MQQQYGFSSGGLLIKNFSSVSFRRHIEPRLLFLLYQDCFLEPRLQQCSDTNIFKHTFHIAFVIEIRKIRRWEYSKHTLGSIDTKIYKDYLCGLELPGTELCSWVSSENRKGKKQMLQIFTSLDHRIFSGGFILLGFNTGRGI